MAGTAGRRLEGELFPGAVSQTAVFVQIFNGNGILPVSYEANNHAGTGIWRMVRGLNTPLPAKKYLT